MGSFQIAFRVLLIGKGKGKTVPLLACSGPEGSRKLSTHSSPKWSILSVGGQEFLPIVYNRDFLSISSFKILFLK
jgi:hypothetical protein